MTKQHFIFIGMIMLTLIGCGKKWQHKYPEDDGKTKDTPTERLTNKWWTLQNATLNGIDYTDSVYQVFGKYQIYFSQNLYFTNATTEIDNYYGSIKSDNESPFTCIWNLLDNDSKTGIGSLSSGTNNIPSLLPCYIYNYSSYWQQSYTILKLSNSEFKINITTKNGDSTITNYFTN